MQTIHGSHHRGRVSEQDYKQSARKRQSQIHLYGIPEDEYVVTLTGQYRCVICSHLPPFLSGRELTSHLRGKKHLTRKESKSQYEDKKREIAMKSQTIPIPTLLYRTEQITKRVISSNHDEMPVVQIRSPLKPALFVPPALSVTGDPLWIQQKQKEQEEVKMISCGFRKADNGEWCRDETIEFDSDDEPVFVKYDVY